LTAPAAPQKVKIDKKARQTGRRSYAEEDAMSSAVLNLTAIERVHMGAPAADVLKAEAERMGARRVFLMVGGHLRRETDEVSKIEAALGVRHATTWSEMSAHTPRNDVLAATLAARAAGADLIVTVGGGSLTDGGKIVALMLRHGVTDREGFDQFRTYVKRNGTVVNPTFDGPDVRIICVPTTLSGGEFNTLAGSTDEVSRHKQGYDHRLMAPVVVVLDPALTVHTPEWLWLSTGVRAVDHAVETLASYRSNAFCDGVADSALRLLAAGLTASKQSPSDLDARLQCQIGAWQSMLAVVGGVPMGASHAIGHVLGAACDVPHGYTSCVMSPYVQAWNAEVDDRRQGRIADCVGAPGLSASAALDRLIRGLGMPRRLSEVGVREDQLALVAEHTLKDIWGRTNPRPISSAEDVMQILRRAF
jgi:alcohol dehydrogenase class IV